jgi:hypothetical protein
MDIASRKKFNKKIMNYRKKLLKAIKVKSWEIIQKLLFWLIEIKVMQDQFF